MNREILFRAKHIHAMDSNEHLDGGNIFDNPELLGGTK